MEYLGTLADRGCGGKTSKSSSVVPQCCGTGLLRAIMAASAAKLQAGCLHSAQPSLHKRAFIIH
jgi:hypothetical protein